MARAADVYKAVPDKSSVMTNANLRPDWWSIAVNAGSSCSIRSSQTEWTMFEILRRRGDRRLANANSASSSRDNYHPRFRECGVVMRSVASVCQSCSCFYFWMPWPPSFIMPPPTPKTVPEAYCIRVWPSVSECVSASVRPERLVNTISQKPMKRVSECVGS